jgi:ABC-type dipeptide/oligopeptide/nickel transport system ATPase component
MLLGLAQVTQIISTARYLPGHLVTNAELTARFTALGRPRRDRAVAALTEVWLPNACNLLGQYPHQLSGGMCQRVLIALAFSSNPRLVIADEPTTALDVAIHPQILRLIAEMQREHATAVIFITHDLRLAHAALLVLMLEAVHTDLVSPSA